MKFLRNSILAATAALAVLAAVRLGVADPAQDTNNTATAGTPQNGGTVTVKISLPSPTPAVSASVVIANGSDARMKALEIANAINLLTQYTATVAPGGSTITVKSTAGHPEVTAVKIDAGTTKEFDEVKKSPSSSGTAMYEFSGVVGTAGTVVIGVGPTQWVFDVSLYATLGDLRNDVASTLTTNGFTASVEPDGTILATIPMGTDSAGLGVFCDTMSADGIGFQPEE